MSRKDTIFALSTPRGRSGVAVIRISGPESQATLRLLGINDVIKPRVAAYRVLCDSGGFPIDQAVILFFPEPNSFTGEDVVELQVHGSPAVIRLIFEELQTKIRMAEPGEFSLRAFLNGKMDLTKAEGIADLINAETRAQLRQAFMQASGVFEELYESWRCALLNILTNLEACIDFPEDVSVDVLHGIHDKIGALCSTLRKHLDDKHKGERLRSGAKVVILGAPNVGKSTLFNFLVRKNVAIVSEYPGTTRDVLEVGLDIDGYPFILVDTAGIRESSDFVELEGIKRAKMAAEDADIRIFMLPYDGIEDLDPNILEDFQDESTVYVLSKADEITTSETVMLSGKSFCPISVHNNIGVDKLLSIIREKSEEVFPKCGDLLITSQRHRGYIRSAVKALMEIREEMPEEIIAEYLRSASEEIGKITGIVHVEDILDDIFKKFCIGK